MVFKIFQFLNAGVALFIGIYCSFWPKAAAESLAIAFSAPHGLTDFRATYGGLCLAFGAFFAMSLFHPDISLRAAHWLALFFYGGLAITRAYGVLFEQGSSTMMVAFLCVEVALAAVAIAALMFS